MKQEFEQALACLIGLPWVDAGRASSMEWFSFGKPRLEIGHRGKPRVIAAYALHVQCPWRICGPAGIVVGSQDLFYPAGDPSVEPPDFDWDVPGSTRRNERMSEFLASRETAPLYVLAVSADEAGSISLDFVGGYSMDVFPSIRSNANTGGCSSRVKKDLILSSQGRG